MVRLHRCLALGALIGFVGAVPKDAMGPGAGPWSVESPEDHGLTSEQVRAAAEHVLSSYRIAVRDCLVIIKDGALIWESYRHPLYNTTAHEGWSITKSIGGLVAGWARSRGLLDLDADITKTYGVRSPRPYPVTTRQLMSQAVAGPDGPGEAWLYDSAGTFWLNTLPEVIHKATGWRTSEIFESIRDVLGLSRGFEWPNSDASWAFGSKGTCRDYARFGQLMLNGGRWKGAPEPIVSRAYVREMTTPQTRFAPYTEYTNPCYGLLTWLNTDPGSDRGSRKYPGECQLWPSRSFFPVGSDPHAYLLAGLYGQDVMVVPRHNMVLVTMGESADDYPIQRLLYEGVCRMFPDECEGEDLSSKPLAI